MLMSPRKSLAACGIAVLLLAGCDMSTPSQVNVTPIQMKDDVRTETIDARNIDRERLAMIADTYVRSGRGPLSLTLAHGVHEAAIAKQQAIQIASAFEKRGVRSLKVNYVVMEDPAYAGKAVLSYQALTASAPAGCTRMPGMDGAETMKEVKKYRLGCEVQTNIARMVSDPSDLMGKGGTPDEDSRRQGIVTEPYNAGKKNEPMQDTLEASEVTEQGG